MALTKEGKKALKESKRLHKLAAEAEARKKAKKEELQREIDFQAKKKSELDRKWRELMLKIKEPIFSKDIEIMWHTFDRAFDKKTNLIQYTMELTDIADDQFQRTTASFCVTIDTMINKFLEDLRDLDKDNDIATAKLLQLGKDTATRIMIDHNAAETHLQLMLYHGDITADSLAWTTRGENLVKQDEDRSKYADDREYLVSSLEDKFNSVWNEYKTVLKEYVMSTAGNQKQVRRLRFKENLMADIIASQGKKIANSDDLLRRLQTELAAYETGTKLAGFRDRRNRHRASCHKLKNTLNNGCALDSRLLIKLVIAADSTISWLSHGAKKAEKILRLAAICREYESLREKTLPYGTTNLQSPTAVDKNMLKTSFVQKAIFSASGLTRLWQRIAKAEMAKRALYHEKMLLIQENSYISSKMQESNKTTFVPETSICRCNDSKKKKSRDRPIAIEGVIEARKYR